MEFPKDTDANRQAHKAKEPERLRKFAKFARVVGSDQEGNEYPAYKMKNSVERSVLDKKMKLNANPRH